MEVMLLYIVNKMEVGNAFDAFCESEASYLFSQECYIKHYVIRIIAQCILLKWYEVLSLNVHQVADSTFMS